MYCMESNGIRIFFWKSVDIFQRYAPDKNGMFLDSRCSLPHGLKPWRYRLPQPQSQHWNSLATFSATSSRNENDVIAEQVLNICSTAWQLLGILKHKYNDSETTRSSSAENDND